MDDELTTEQILCYFSKSEIETQVGFLGQRLAWVGIYECSTLRKMQRARNEYSEALRSWWFPCKCLAKEKYKLALREWLQECSDARPVRREFAAWNRAKYILKGYIPNPYAQENKE